MQFMRRIVCAVIIVSILSFCFTTGHATESTTPLSEQERSLLIQALQSVDAVKDVWNLSSMNFSDLCVGFPIQTYIYTENTFHVSQELHPLTVNNRIVLWAVKYNNTFLISSGLVDKINRTVAADTEFAILYDAVGAYVYSEGMITQISQNPQRITDRSEIVTCEQNLDCISTTALSQNIPLGYSSVSRSLPMSHFCNVTYVPQSASETCWVATTALIYNFLNNLTGSAALEDWDVVERFYGSRTNRHIDYDQIADLFDIYNIPYFGSDPINTATIDEEVILESIANDYPVFGRFGCGSISSSDEHASAIIAYNLWSDYMSVVDPNGGTYLMTANSSNQYVYYCDITGTTLYLKQVFCKEFY